MSQNVRLFHVLNLSVRNFPNFLLMYPGSSSDGVAVSAVSRRGPDGTGAMLQRHYRPRLPQGAVYVPSPSPCYPPETGVVRPHCRVSRVQCRPSPAPASAEYGRDNGSVVLGFMQWMIQNEIMLFRNSYT